MDYTRDNECEKFSPRDDDLPSIASNDELTQTGKNPIFSRETFMSVKGILCFNVLSHNT